MTNRPLTALVLSVLLLGSALAAAGPVGTTVAANAAGNAAGNEPADVGTAAGGDDWPTLGHDEANTGYSPNVTGPQTTVVEKWKFDPDAGFGTSPVVTNGTVYAAGQNDRLYALDETTGAVEWARNGSFSGYGTAPAVTDGVVYAPNGSQVAALAAANGTELWTHSTGSLVTTATTVVDGTVYAGTNDGTIYALNATTGAEQWTHSVGIYLEGGIAVADGRVYFGADDGNVYALDAADGSEAWRHETTGYPFGPTVSDGTVYAGDGDENLYAIDAATGTEEWTFSVEYPDGIGKHAVADGTVYGVAEDGTLYAVNADTGTERWNETVGVANAAPAVAGDTVYVVTKEGDLGSSDDNYASAFDADTGARLWQYELGYTDTPRSSPAVVDGSLYVGVVRDGLYALSEPPIARFDRTAEEPAVGESVTFDASASESRFGSIASYEWDLDGDGTTDATGEQVTTRYERAGGYSVSLTVTDSNGIPNTTQTWVPVANPDRGPLRDAWPTRGHDAARTGTATATGIVGDVRERWSRPLGAAVVGTPVVANDTVYGSGSTDFVDGSPVLYALNASTGGLVWNYTAENITGGQFAAPTVGDGTVYLGDEFNQVYAVNATTGATEWTNELETRSRIPFQQAPVYTGDTVLVGTETPSRLLPPGEPLRTVYALDADTGEQRWNHSVSADTGLAAANGTVYVGESVSDLVFGSDSTPDSRLHALNVTTGEAEWNYPTTGTVSTVAVQNGTVYGTNRDGYAFALDAATGAEVWNRSVSTTTREVFAPRPTVSDGTLYLATDSQNLSAIDAATGAFEWNHSTGGRVAPFTAVVNGTVYVPVLPPLGSFEEGGRVLGLDADTGTPEWSTQVGRLSGGVAVVGDRFYLPAAGTERETPLLSAYEGTADTGPTPVAEASATSVTTGDTVTFDARNSTDDTRLVRTYWRFDNGTTTDATRVERTYESSGIYRVTLTATDTAGYRTTETVTVTVSEPDTGGSVGGGGGGGGAGGGTGGASTASDDDETEDIATEAAEIEDGDATFGDETPLVRVDFAESVSGTVEASVVTDPDAEMSREAADAANGGDAVSFVDISPSSDAAAETPATVELTVDREELDDPEDAVVVHRTETGWVSLPTTAQRIDDGTVSLVAEVDSFSVFAVVERDSQQTTTPATTERPTQVTTTTETDVDETTTRPATPTDTETASTPATTTAADGPGFGPLAAVLAVALLVAVTWRRSRH
ncbi:outer membrane protein assembly factor BamB family protein [Halorientalis litorea]|uniref:outer membrane protein assembly factor BamB family protein n=1 Tax=Halorientalis litorea TaxID=2931977 RepID=UPI001FF5C12F|nr:PQQ-binding-like beta-propeller repeat protein [Halorientalis litorea]